MGVTAVEFWALPAAERRRVVGAMTATERDDFACELAHHQSLIDPTNVMAVYPYWQRFFVEHGWDTPAPPEPAPATLFYSDDYVQLYSGDNRSLAAVVAKCDHILTDMPFSAKTHAGASSNPAGWESGGNSARPIVDFDSVSADQVLDYLALWGPKTRAWVISFLDWRHMLPVADALEGQSHPSGLRFVRHGIWDKPNGSPSFSGDRPAQGWEAIAIMHRLGGRMAWNGGGKRGVWCANKVNGAHPTEKPQKLLEALIRDFTKPGDVIVDPFAGSFAVAQACKRLGRKCIAIELDPKYAEVGAKRCAWTVPLATVEEAERVGPGVQLMFGEE